MALAVSVIREPACDAVAAVDPLEQPDETRRRKAKTVDMPRCLKDQYQWQVPNASRLLSGCAQWMSGQRLKEKSAETTILREGVV